MKTTAFNDRTMNLWDLGRGDLANFEQACKREWLVTNGLGGFAAGTVADANTRRYHGLLIAALKPPLERTVMLAKLDATVNYCGLDYSLSSNEFADGSIDPHGYRHIERFRLDAGLPVWEYAFNDVLIEKRIIMPQGENTTLVKFRVLRASAALHLNIRPLCTHRDYHSHTQGGWDFQTETMVDGFRIDAYQGAQPYYIRANGSADVLPVPGWYWRFRHRIEAERGLDETEDLYSPGSFAIDLSDGDAVTVAISTEPDIGIDFDSVLTAEHARRHALIADMPQPIDEPWVDQLVYAADQFIVARGLKQSADGRTVIAGYPWFGDWGRDTMIALPGLTLTTGRYEVAKSILLTFAQHIDHGMLPNRFPDSGEEPEYNTVDATLWYVNAIFEYTRRSGKLDLAKEILDAVIDIVEWHRRGTRYNIHVDPDDGLLWAGEEGAQLTWMDAKVGDWVVTPRIGKAVEINALWHNALKCIADLAKRLGKTAVAAEFRNAAEQVSESFSRFWNDDRDCLYDVIDGPVGIEKADGRRYDASLRPNQILAVSLRHCPLDAVRQRAVVDSCARNLVTSYGLRSLAKDSSAYVGHYAGGQVERDGAYHQGTVWSWLLAPFAEAHFRVYGDAERARSFLRPLGGHLREACVGSISEIFDGDAPHRAQGCFAQAWSVSETLRVWTELGNRSDDATNQRKSQ
jgi:predicted glycogen debranching enzyme